MKISSKKALPSHEMLKKVLVLFSLLWIISGAGVIIGQFVPEALLLPLMIFEIILLIAMVFVRKSKKVGKTFAMVFAFISGITLYPILLHYAGEMGGEIVLAVFVSTAVVFAAYGLIGYRKIKTWLAGPATCLLP